METIKRLVGNTVFPTAFVITGNLVNDWYQRSIEGLTQAQKSSTGVTISNLAQKAWEGCSVANAKSFVYTTGELAFAAGKSVYHLVPEPQVKSIGDLLAAHSVEIGATASIGALATIVDTVLKRVPYINRSGTLRVATSIGLASTAVYLGANELKYNVNPAMLIDIAIKVGFIGIVWKSVTLGGEYAFKGLGKASPIAEKVFSYFCSTGESIFHSLSYGELPKGVRVSSARKRKEGQESANSSRTSTPVKKKQGETPSSSRSGTPAKGLPTPQFPKEEVQQPVQDEREVVSEEEDSVVEHPTTPKGQRTGDDPNITASGHKIEDISHEIGDTTEHVRSSEDEGESDSAE